MPRTPTEYAARSTAQPPTTPWHGLAPLHSGERIDDASRRVLGVAQHGRRDRLGAEHAVQPLGAEHIP
jgi:hypothetical protein